MILLDHQNNYVGNSSMINNAVKSFDILATNLNVLHNHFDDPTKLFSDICLVEVFSKIF